MSEGWETLDAGDPAAQHLQQANYQPSGLRQAREATGLHIAALAAALKVPVKKLEALEAGRYEELPDLTFARALASSACRQLKIDAAPILDLIPHAHAPVLGATTDGVNAPFKSDQGGQSASALLARFQSPTAWITGAILLAALGLAFLPNWSEWPGKDLLAKGGAWMESWKPAETVSSGGQVVVPLETEALQPPSDGAAVSEPTAEPASVVAEANPTALKSETGLGAESNRTASANSVLHLEATNDSWVEVIDGAGKVQIQRVIRKGDVLDFSASPPYSVVLGRADAVLVQVRGQPFDVSPFARNSVARFPVK